MRGWLWVTLILGAAACEVNPFAPVGNVERFTPPPEYRTWYAEMEACTGRRGNYDAVVWWLVDSLTTPVGWHNIAATWTAPHTVRIRRGYKGNDWVVRHEMLHDILQTVDQPSPPFGVCNRPAPAVPARNGRTGRDAWLVLRDSSVSASRTHRAPHARARDGGRWVAFPWPGSTDRMSAPTRGSRSG